MRFLFQITAVALLATNQSVVGQTSRSEPATAPAAPSNISPTSPSLTGFWNGQAVWARDADNIGGSFGFHFISILPSDGCLSAYYINGYAAADGKFKMTVGRAHGTNGLDWTDDGRVLDVGHAGQGTNGPLGWDDRLASFPGIWKEGNTWYLVYEGAAEDKALYPGDIGLATSTDGTNFVKHPANPILRHHTNGWERANIGTPSLYKENGTWYLFYHGFDYGVCQIGVASGTSLTNLTKSAANPIVRASRGKAAWDSGTIGRRSAIMKEGNYYYMAFEGSTPQPYEQAKWSSGLARSANLTAKWSKFPGNPVIPQTPGGMGYDGPELLRLGGTMYLYVRMPIGNRTGRFRLEVLHGR